MEVIIEYFKAFDLFFLAFILTKFDFILNFDLLVAEIIFSSYLDYQLNLQIK